MRVSRALTLLALASTVDTALATSFRDDTTTESQLQELLERKITKVLEHGNSTEHEERNPLQGAIQHVTHAIDLPRNNAGASFSIKSLHGTEAVPDPEAIARSSVKKTQALGDHGKDAPVVFKAEKEALILGNLRTIQKSSDEDYYRALKQALRPTNDEFAGIDVSTSSLLAAAVAEKKTHVDNFVKLYLKSIKLKDQGTDEIAKVRNTLQQMSLDGLRQLHNNQVYLHKLQQLGVTIKKGDSGLHIQGLSLQNPGKVDTYKAANTDRHAELFTQEGGRYKVQSIPMFLENGNLKVAMVSPSNPIKPMPLFPRGGMLRNEKDDVAAGVLRELSEEAGLSGKIVHYSDMFQNEKDQIATAVVLLDRSFISSSENARFPYSLSLGDARLLSSLRPDMKAALDDAIPALTSMLEKHGKQPAKDFSFTVNEPPKIVPGPIPGVATTV
ncbi:hypothetical protein CCR75_008158 [Bremia lactucae]|uniref:Nudix hydrolase domain-containing protein n=1 Tax=Bremia lactucae TaxID=4779 RepID=A0A976FH27_BRELC|nr:hypothetical protein CCR75_008158 [Bremia lactucae]